MLLLDVRSGALTPLLALLSTLAASALSPRSRPGAHDSNEKGPFLRVEVKDHAGRAVPGVPMYLMWFQSTGSCATMHSERRS